ncbi:hypothetical protein KY290_012935 [Solanum tuberosum]|uniref:Uncharacterized protein n=1 Tax=Solanum tuberosum TaxID=4113 RepID=A0ABQ7VK69_SOLTU|nr:hypothetical protein KY285_012704 [Solanum tuberosum]KAH0768954.1 hypothetical protein KY290_012935 [Solanum tuberosum]
MDAVCGGSFMTKPFLEIMVIMNEVSKNNRACHTIDVEVRYLRFTFELSVEKRKREEEWDQDMAHLKSQMDLIMKHLTTGQETVNAVGAANKYEEQEVDFDEEAKYLNN